VSRTWDLVVGADARTPIASVRLSEAHQDLELAIEYPGLAELACYLDDEAAREIRDWLSWYLGEGPEPDGESIPSRATAPRCGHWIRLPDNLGSAPCACGDPANHSAGASS
jgi:hypothetical protein